jgi:hypothetical protein
VLTMYLLQSFLLMRYAFHCQLLAANVVHLKCVLQHSRCISDDSQQHTEVEMLDITIGSLKKEIIRRAKESGELEDDDTPESQREWEFVTDNSDTTTPNSSTGDEKEICVDLQPQQACTFHFPS